MCVCNVNLGTFSTVVGPLIPNQDLTLMKLKDENGRN